METVEIDKKIAALKEEIEKLEKQKNEKYKKVGEYWLGNMLLTVMLNFTFIMLTQVAVEFHVTLLKFM